MAFCTSIIRLLPIPFGVHTVLITIILFIFIDRLNKEDHGLSFLASFVTIITLIIYESVCLSLFMFSFGFTPETIFKDSVIRTVAGEPHVILLFISAFLLNILFKKGTKKRINEKGINIRVWSM